MPTRDVVPELIYALSHDIGDPLHDVLDRSRALGARAPADADPRWWEELGRLEASAARTRAMLATLCRWLSATADEEPVERVDLGRLLDDALRDTQAVRDLHPTRVEATLSGEIVTHGALLHDALVELITNAARHGAATSGEATVTVRVLAGDDGLHLEVTDRGPGIPASRRAHALTLFRSVAPTGDDTLGAGLAVLARRVGAVGGTLRLSDPPSGSGLRVWVTLPLPTGDEARGRTDHAPIDDVLPIGGVA